MSRLRTTTFAAFVLVAFDVQAQDEPSEASSAPEDEVVIEDPELQGVPIAAPPAAPARPVSAPPGQGALWAPSPDRAQPVADTSALFRLELRTRIGVDTAWESSFEDVFEATETATLEAVYRKSETLSFAVGLRARHHYTRRMDAVLGDPDRTELDAVPISGYVDMTSEDGVHVRAGYQIIEMGRFDFWSATNILAVYDLRSGPAATPDAAQIAQPALRIDLHPMQWLTLQSYYVPFFQPHLVTIYGSDYALLAIADRLLEDEDANRDVVDAVRLLRRSDLARLSTGAVSLLAPQPTIEHPQGALRATARFSAGELSLTAGTALEHLPGIELHEAFGPLFDQADSAPLATAIAEGEDLIAIRYNRFSLLSLDGATDIGPVQVGAELAYVQNRTFFATAPGAAPLPGTTDIAQVALRGEYIASERWVAAVEGFFYYALDEPGDPRRSWMTLEEGRYLRGVAFAGRVAPFDIPLALDGSLMFLSGPTWFIAPRLEWEAAERLFFELGVFIVEGPKPDLDAEVAIGGIYDPIDQVYTGVRWVP